MVAISEDERFAFAKKDRYIAVEKTADEIIGKLNPKEKATLAFKCRDKTYVLSLVDITPL